ncbi:FMN-binding negative transcriptional regulator [Elizabethkingia meningoseptica]|uniref:FMN-binding negative transcriptional regulator n=1 Tax=Elizabethkingia meningoseptica TaxID=238 RepID=UPI0023B0A8A7|nr:FMN-binding negative transcriptional regulator [Elizabethkingia meningoseptica]MDE5439294.1 FMN-binding negative transcriptional regulator [Elizabethkingia meningoseptica]MDE5451175.1 FMN-binding negative transcriptional regulator [Elizabethkingia meningoseptica]MDE5510066.1 FMN-binding negative transcriptional regulator [Elizabethkingia meningoseptica]MDE5517030.1 FMN-binding negative transcriptional regulator [Elizabethkingia meningoseptica]MDE5527635.1 FMN-binding negative transcriptiona
MHIPKIYKSEDFALLKEIISKHSFGLLISDKEKLFATHSMFLMNGKQDDFFLETHISKANFQAKALKNGDHVLCDFLGAHTYISSSWYDHTNVSTWNYEAVQVRGTVHLMTDEELYHHLEKLTEKYEKYQQCPMFVKNMGDEFVRKEMKGAFGIKIIPDEVFIKSKLSQNRNEENLERIIGKLQAQDDQDAQIIAKKMQQVYHEKSHKTKE